jgi:hypothetical protein
MPHASEARLAQTPLPDPEQIAREVLRLAAARGVSGNFSPLDVAGSLSSGAMAEWAPLLAVIRAVAVELAAAGRLVILRNGKPVDPHDFRGAFQLALPHAE